MQLYKVWQTDNTGGGTHDAMIVSARSIEDARRMSPDDWRDENTWADCASNVKVELVGKISMKEEGIILASWNAPCCECECTHDDRKAKTI